MVDTMWPRRGPRKIMFLIEPETCYLERLGKAKPVTIATSVAVPHQMSRTNPPTTTNAPQAINGAKLEVCEGKLPDDFWTEWILETLAFDGQPMLITRLVNAVVTWGNFSGRAQRQSKKVELFKVVGKLVRVGRLERVARKYVTLPATDERYRAYLAKSAVSIELPKANV
jgi:hypothetical protein